MRVSRNGQPRHRRRACDDYGYRRGERWQRGPDWCEYGDRVGAGAVRDCFANLGRESGVLFSSVSDEVVGYFLGDPVA